MPLLHASFFLWNMLKVLKVFFFLSDFFVLHLSS